MISIRIIEVDNLPIPSKKARKTSIYCFSNSSYHYYYGSFKTRTKSTHPCWNSVIDIDFFRLVELDFLLFATKFCSKSIYIGKVEINFIDFISKSPGDEIFSNPGSCIRCEFPIVTTTSTNSYLSLSFTYIPKIFKEIHFKPISYPKQIIHVYATYSPAVGNSKAVEIEFLQASPLFDENRRRLQNGIFYHLNSDTPWECSGKSSAPHYVRGATGMTEVHSICLTKIEGNVTFFILNVGSFDGTVSVNFVCEKKGQFRHFSNRSYMKPKVANPKIGIIQTIDVPVRSNTKKLVPVFHHFGLHPFKPSSFEFLRCEAIEVDKSALHADDYSERVSAEIDFHNAIMRNVLSIQETAKINFLRVSVLPSTQKVSLARTLDDYSLAHDGALRFYVGGSTTYANGSTIVVDGWKHGFVAYDKKTGQKCPEILNMIKIRKRSLLPLKYKWNSILGLNMNHIGTDKVLVYFLHCDSCLESANAPGFFMISHLCNQVETLLFRNKMFPELCKEHFATCCRIEFMDDDWKIVPMRHYFREMKEMEFAVDSMQQNNWIMPVNLLNPKNDWNEVEASDDDFLIG